MGNRRRPLVAKVESPTPDDPPQLDCGQLQTVSKRLVREGSETEVVTSYLSILLKDPRAAP